MHTHTHMHTLANRHGVYAKIHEERHLNDHKTHEAVQRSCHEAWQLSCIASMLSCHC